MFVIVIVVVWWLLLYNLQRAFSLRQRESRATIYLYGRARVCERIDSRQRQEFALHFTLVVCSGKQVEDSYTTNEQPDSVKIKRFARRARHRCVLSGIPCGGLPCDIAFDCIPFAHENRARVSRPFLAFRVLVM